MERSVDSGAGASPTTWFGPEVCSADLTPFVEATLSVNVIPSIKVVNSREVLLEIDGVGSDSGKHLMQIFGL